MSYFPPKNPSQRLVEATEALKAKGYGFSTDKKLCQIDPETDKLDEESGFVFEVKKGDQKFNQKNYEEIGDIITEYVYGLLESDPINLVRLEFPPDQGKYFTSLDIMFNPTTISIIFHFFQMRNLSYMRVKNTKTQKICAS